MYPEFPAFGKERLLLIAEFPKNISVGPKKRSFGTLNMLNDRIDPIPLLGRIVIEVAIGETAPGYRREPPIFRASKDSILISLVRDGREKEKLEVFRGPNVLRFIDKFFDDHVMPRVMVR